MPASPPRPRVALLYEIPAPYRLPFFERLAREEAFDLEVLFQNRHQVDREWDLQDTLPFPHRFLPVRQIVFRGKDFFTYLINPGIWRVFREGRYDVVVVGSYIHQSSLAAILRCWLTRTPYLLMCESHLGTPRAWWKRWLKALAIRPIISRAAAWLPNGTAAKAYLTAYGARPERIFFSPNTIDVPTFARTIDRLRAEADACRRKEDLPERFVLFVGRLVPVKDLGTLLTAFARVQERLPEVGLVLVGSGPEEAALQAQARALGLGVRFAGFRQGEDLLRFYAAAACFVLPSISETWGVVVNEAMAAELPVVLSREVGCVPDLLEEGENGFSFPARDARTLADQLIATMEHEDRRRRMGERSRTIVRNFGYEYCLDQFRRAIAAAWKARP